MKFETNEKGGWIIPAASVIPPYTRIPPWSEIGHNSKVGHACVVGRNCCCGFCLRVGHGCCFGSECKFGLGCGFGDRCEFGRECKLGSSAGFGDGCTFDPGCEFDDLNLFGCRCAFGPGIKFGPRCKFGPDCRFDHSCMFGATCKFGEACEILLPYIQGPGCVFAQPAEPEKAPELPKKEEDSIPDLAARLIAALVAEYPRYKPEDVQSNITAAIRRIRIRSLAAAENRLREEFWRPVSECLDGWSNSPVMNVLSHIDPQSWDGAMTSLHGYEKRPAFFNTETGDLYECGDWNQLWKFTHGDD